MGGAPTRVNSPMIQTLGQTTNFTITYDDAFGDARHRAEALQRTCEKDFSRLASWFGVSAGFGPSNRATLQVETQSLANNNGYRANGTIRCSLHHFDGAVDAARADDAVRALFVAEFAEVLMSYRNQTVAPTWNPAGSDGEGLSRVCAAVFYPDAYYDPAFLAGPFVNPWLTSSGRTDWVDSREASDVAIDSFGCSILFLYWLHDQLGYSWHDIITKAGATLAATYTALTGRTDAFTAFTTLLAEYFPIGKTPALKTDDPFPLRASSARQVSIVVTKVPAGFPLPIGGRGTVHVRPFVTCPADDYHYTVWVRPQRIRCEADVVGFGQPDYAWWVNGMKWARGGGTSHMTVQAAADRADPQAPGHPATTVESVKVACTQKANTSTWAALSGELDIEVLGSPGHVHLTVEAIVTEKYAGGSASAFATPTADTRSVVYEQRFYDDKRRCVRAFREAIPDLERHPWTAIDLAKTLPDPPPEVIRVARMLDAVRAEIAALAGEDPRVARRLAAGLASGLGVSAQLFAATSRESLADAVEPA